MIDVGGPRLLWEVLSLGRWAWTIQGDKPMKPWRARQLAAPFRGPCLETDCTCKPYKPFLSELPLAMVFILGTE